MTETLTIRCTCGQFEGVASDISPDVGNHIVCYCDDCQCFQHYLGQADTVLDANGGTDVFQMSPARLSITKGAEQLACLRLRPNGIVRWYTRCCNTPVGNTLATPALPFVGMVTACLDRSREPCRVDEALGPVTGGVFGKFAIGNRDELEAYDKAPVSMIFGFLANVVRWRIAGAHKQSPFFDASTGALIREPKILTAQELDDVKRRQASSSARR